MAKSLTREQIDAISQIAYEADRAWYAGVGVTLPAWVDAPMRLQNQARRFVVAYADDANCLKKDHDDWLAVMLAQGWTSGASEDPKTKKNPRLVSYAELPADTRSRDQALNDAVDQPIKDAIKA